MSLLVGLAVAYVVIDRLLTIGLVGKSFKITPSTAVVSTITGVFLVAALVSE